MIGKTLSHFKLTAKLGEGGMGEVYQATDAKLGREVAIKVLPEALTQYSERLERFEREAQVLASLNHPNVAAIHAVGEHDGIHYLVMELVDGETLSERLTRGAVSVGEATSIALQIAQGLEAAHERGVIHRDLKPANIKVGVNGIVKILDFGLAKEWNVDGPITEMTKAPTLSAGLTRAGVVVGTAAYMAPEQARGLEVDKRCDIWAFGVVLYEMLVGSSPFAEPDATPSDVLAAVLRAEVDLEDIPSEVPFRIRDLLHRCLQKDPKERLRDIGDARLLIEDRDREPLSDGAPTNGAPSRRWPVVLPWSLAALMTLALAAALLNPRAVPREPIQRFAIPTAGPIVDLGRPAVVLSPSGEYVAYVADVDGRTMIHLRRLDGFDSDTVAGTSGAESLFWSPDSEWIGFFADNRLKKVSIRGGAPITLWEVPNNVGASWGADGSIVFNLEGRLVQIDAQATEIETLVELNAVEGAVPWWPEHLPGGHHLLYTETTGAGGTIDQDLALLSLATGEIKILVERASYGKYLSSGHLLFLRGASLYAAPFDLDLLELTEAPTLILEGGFASTDTFGSAQVSVSRDGIFAYLPGASTAVRSLAWSNRTGKAELLIKETRAYYMPRLSPDGTKVAVTISDGGELDVWILDLERQRPRRLTSEGSNAAAVWSPDGSQIAYGSTRESGNGVFVRSIDGLQPERRVTETAFLQYPTAWSPDSQNLAVTESTETEDILVVAADGSGQPIPVAAGANDQNGAVFSPDGRWLAYTSATAGRWEVIVQPFPEGGSSQPRVVGDGLMPCWSSDGSELFFLSGPRSERMMVASVDLGENLEISAPYQLFVYKFAGSIGLGLRRYDVTSDGDRFIFATEGAEREVSQIHVVLDWADEVARRTQ